MTEQARHNILLSCEVKTIKEQDPFVHEHVLALILSGSMDFRTGEEVVCYPTGTLGLLKRNQLVKVTKRPDGEKPFAAIYIKLEQEALKKFSLNYQVTPSAPFTGEPVIPIELDSFFKAYFDSLQLYVDQPAELTPAIATLKTAEAIALLIRIPKIKNLLFDFSAPHKIDLAVFMNRYYAYNVPLSQFAQLTGRSISTFRRDFVHLFHETPEKWLVKRRLKMAYCLISAKGWRPSDVYLEVGFENFSHFSAAFKREFNLNASNLAGALLVNERNPTLSAGGLLPTRHA